VRIVGGRFGGRRISAPAGQATRPTSDRVREALFSILGPLHDDRVVDLYAGSGALGIEALSRGAEHAVFVERDARAAGVLRANLDALGIAPDEAELRRMDALAALRDASTRGETYSLALIDPPYRLASGLGPSLSEVLAPVLAPDARVVCETDRRAPIDLDLPLLDERRYGDTLLRIHRA
jgi:16S rRNA (guanine966-N2)-methyltransferase